MPAKPHTPRKPKGKGTVPSEWEAVIAVTATVDVLIYVDPDEYNLMDTRTTKELTILALRQPIQPEDITITTAKLIAYNDTANLRKLINEEN